MAKSRERDKLPEWKFRIVTTGCEIELVRLKRTTNGQRIARPIYEFKYLNRPGNRANRYADKPNFTTYIEDINEQLGRKLWISI